MVASSYRVNGGANTAKDWILGRETELSDHAVDSVLSMFGVSRWALFQARQKGVGTAVQNLAAPPLTLYDDATKDLTKLSQGELTPATSELIERFPLVGKVYYHRLGAGVDK